MAKTVALKIRKIGNSCGLILSREQLNRLHLQDGDELYAIDTPGGLLLTPYDPDFATAIESTRDYMRRHRNALRELSEK